MIEVSEEAGEKLNEILNKYISDEGNIMSILHDIQETFGYIPEDTVNWFSKRLDIPESRLFGVATFYTMYKHKPMGEHLIQLCTNVSCMILGAERLVDFLKHKYNLEVGGTTPDGRFSLMIMECIGGCDVAPAMLVDNDYYGNLTQERIEEILERYK